MASTDTTFPLTGPIDLSVRLGSGSVTVAAHDGLGEALVRLVPRHGHRDLLERVTVEMQGRTLVVAGPRPGGLADLVGRWRQRDSIDAYVEVPSGTAINISAAGDDVTVIGACGDADVATTAARISFDTVAGNLRLRFDQADSRVHLVTGSVRLRAGTGTAYFGEVEGPLECRFGSGELVADVVRGELRWRAGSASAQIAAVYSDVDLAVGSGPIHVGVPAGISALVDVMSGTGQVHAELPVEGAPTPRARTITLRARTGSGEVRIVRTPAT
jgi:hypothetical protein